MKRILMTFFVLLLVFTSVIQAQDKPKVFINTNSTVGIFIAVNSGFSQFANIARNLGYTVDHGLHPSIKPEYLEGIDVYILAAPPYFLQNSEKVALRQFIRAGGTLILMGWYTEYNESSFAQEFGIQFDDYAITPQKGYIAANSSIEGPNNVVSTYHKGRRAITITNASKAKPLVYLEDGTLVAAEGIGSYVGKGKFLAMNCIDSWAKQYVGGSIELEDNVNFVKNVLEYCRGSQDLAVTFVKPKGVKPEPGDNVKLVVKVKNLGTRTSEATKLSFYLTDDGLLEDAGEFVTPSEVIKRLTTINVPGITAGSVKRIVTTGKIPSWVAPGEYILMAEVDPNNTSGDSDITNNVKTAKKKLIVK